MHLESGLCHQVGVDISREQGREFLCFWERREREANLFVASSFLPYPAQVSIPVYYSISCCTSGSRKSLCPAKHSRDSPQVEHSSCEKFNGE